MSSLRQQHSLGKFDRSSKTLENIRRSNTPPVSADVEDDHVFDITSASAARNSRHGTSAQSFKTDFMGDVESMLVGKQLLRDMALKELRHRLREKNNLIEAHRSRIRVLEFELEKHNIPLPTEFGDVQGDGLITPPSSPEHDAALQDPNAELMLENSLLKYIFFVPNSKKSITICQNSIH